MVFGYMSRAEDVLLLGATCRSAWQALCALPVWLPYQMQDAKWLPPTPFASVLRSLRILACRRCELCQGGGVTGCHNAYPVFAHDKCVDNHLQNESDHKELAVRAKLVATPCVIKRGLKLFDNQFWSANYYWVLGHPLLPKVLTIHGVGSFPSDAAAQAAKAEYDAQCKVRLDLLQAHQPQIQAFAAARARQKEAASKALLDKIAAKLQARMAKLDAQLASGCSCVDSFFCKFGIVFALTFIRLKRACRQSESWRAAMVLTVCNTRTVLGRFYPTAQRCRIKALSTASKLVRCFCIYLMEIDQIYPLISRQ
jgi:hypothetical protein